MSLRSLEEIKADLKKITKELEAHRDFHATHKFFNESRQLHIKFAINSIRQCAWELSPIIKYLKKGSNNA